MKKLSVLFVCLGNICRSPTAEGIFRHLVRSDGLADRITIDSAGTGDWHVDRPPDERAQEAALRRDIDLSGLRGRQVNTEDFKSFDYVLAMDGQNLSDLQQLARSAGGIQPCLFLEGQDVPDPYYGGGEGFEQVLDLIEEGSRALLARIRSEHVL